MRFLTIQKEYYDAIKRGEKTKEWRGINKNTEFLLEYDLDKIAFHYYRKNRLIVDLIKVRHIKTPAWLYGQHGIGDKCICLELGGSVERYKR